MSQKRTYIAISKSLPEIKIQQALGLIHTLRPNFCCTEHFVESRFSTWHGRTLFFLLCGASRKKWPYDIYNKAATLNQPHKLGTKMCKGCLKVLAKRMHHR